MELEDTNTTEQDKKIVVHENIHRLKIGDKNIALIGTAHVSQESADLVKEVIETERPDSVCIELCESRYQSMKNPDKWRNMDIVSVIKEGKALILIINFMLSSFQRKIAKKLGVTPGQEMIQAIHSAEEINSHVEVVDRDVRTTISRTWGLMGFKSKFNLITEMVGMPTILMMLAIPMLMLGKIMYPELITGKILGISIAALFGISFFAAPKSEEDELTKEKLEDMKKQDTLELLLAEMAESVPDIKKRLIDERDLFMVEMLRRAPGTNLVAIVGAGHVAQPLAEVGVLLGFSVSVLDDRPDFATVERIYEVAGLEMTEAAAAEIRAHLTAPQRGRHGRVVRPRGRGLGVQTLDLDGH
ncbi:MAG: TraB/GumN family protein, partial [Lentisphaeraceae bacterium]|nr:TraB/GumN family protein [Lentisphaeraceae bacterium]